MSLSKVFVFFAASLLLGRSDAYSIDASAASISLTDSKSSLPSSVLFVDESASVSIEGLVWMDGEKKADFIQYETLVNGEVQSFGNITLPDDPLALPNSIEVGEIIAAKRRKTSIEVRLVIAEAESKISFEVQAIAAWMASVPFIIALLFAIFNPRKEFGLLAAIFIGSFMVDGTLSGGFLLAINDALIGSIADVSHAYIYLFAFSMSGLAVMIRKSGGVEALKSWLSDYSTQGQRAQMFFLGIGLFMFFDPYASVIIVGELLSLIVTVFPVSVEKLAFIIDSTAAPVASILPGSSWTSIIVPILQEELDKIIDLEGTDDLAIATTGFSVLLKSMKYQFYPIFMILLMPMVILSQRDVGWMLIAERTRCVRHMLGLTSLQTKKGYEPPKVTGSISSFVIPVVILNAFLWACYGVYVPETMDTEKYPSYPLMALLASVFATVIMTHLFYAYQSSSVGYLDLTHLRIRADNPDAVLPVIEYSQQNPGDDGSQQTLKTSPSKIMTGNQSAEIVEHSANGLEIKISGSQPDQPGSTVQSKVQTFEDEFEVMKSMSGDNMETTRQHQSDIEGNANTSDVGTEAIKAEEHERIEIEIEELPPTDAQPSRITSLLSVRETIACFSEGGSKVVNMLVLLTLVWALRIVFTQVGFDRLFAMFLANDRIKPELLPSLVFGVSMVVSLVVRSAFGTTLILLPLVAVPAYEASLGNPDIFYGALGALFSGAVAGEHMSPISDTSMLTCLSTSCGLTEHFLTQAPYSMFVSLVAFSVGTLAVSHDAYPVLVAYPLGIVGLIFYVFIFCCPIVEPKGNFDIFTEVYNYFFPSKNLDALRNSIVEVYRIEDEELGDKAAREALARALVSHGTFDLMTSSSGRSMSRGSSYSSTHMYRKCIDKRRQIGSGESGSLPSGYYPTSTMGSGSYSDASSATNSIENFVSKSASSECDSRAENQSQLMAMSSLFLRGAGQGGNESKDAASYESNSDDDSEGGDSQSTQEQDPVKGADPMKAAPSAKGKSQSTIGSGSIYLPPVAPKLKAGNAAQPSTPSGESTTHMEQETVLMSPKSAALMKTAQAKQSAEESAPKTLGGRKKQSRIKALLANAASKKGSTPPPAPLPSRPSNADDTGSSNRKVQVPSDEEAGQKIALSDVGTKQRKQDDMAEEGSWESNDSGDDSDSSDEDDGDDDDDNNDGDEENASLEEDDQSYDTYGPRPKKKYTNKKELSTKRCDQFYF